MPIAAPRQKPIRTSSVRIGPVLHAFNAAHAWSVDRARVGTVHALPCRDLQLRS